MAFDNPAHRPLTGGYPRRLSWPLWVSLDQWRIQARKLVRRAALPGSTGRLTIAPAPRSNWRTRAAGMNTWATPAVFLAHHFDESRAVFDRQIPRNCDRNNVPHTRQLFGCHVLMQVLSQPS